MDSRPYRVLVPLALILPMSFTPLSQKGCEHMQPQNPLSTKNEVLQRTNELLARIDPQKSKRLPENAPAFTEKEDYYHPNICRTCKCELALGVHGYLYGGYDQQAHKTIIKNCPTCTVEAEQQAVAIQQA